MTLSIRLGSFFYLTIDNLTLSLAIPGRLGLFLSPSSFSIDTQGEAF